MELTNNPVFMSPVSSCPNNHATSGNTTTLTMEANKAGHGLRIRLLGCHRSLEHLAQVAGARIDIGARFIQLRQAENSEVTGRGRPEDLHDAVRVGLGARHRVEIALAAGDRESAEHGASCGDHVFHQGPAHFGHQVMILRLFQAVVEGVRLPREAAPVADDIDDLAADIS